MKRFIWLLAVIVLVVPLVLAACGGGATTTTTRTTTTSMTPPTTTTTSTTRTTTTTTVAPPTTTTVTTSVSATRIPANHGNPVNASYQQCRVCHETGVGEAPELPASHVGRGNETCQGCHQPT